MILHSLLAAFFFSSEEHQKARASQASRYYRAQDTSRKSNMSIISRFNDSGKYLASVLLRIRGGKSDVQIVKIGGSNEVIAQFELEEQVQSISWVSEQTKRSSPKKRKASENVSADLDASKKDILCLELGNGELFVVDTITPNAHKTIKSFSTLISQRGWAIQSGSNTISEISVLTGKQAKSLKVDAEDSYSFICNIQTIADANAAQLLLGGAQGSLYLVDPSKTSKKCILNSFTGSTSKVLHVGQSKVNRDVFSVVRDAEPMVYLYSLGNSEPVAQLNVESEHIRCAKFMSIDDEERLFVFTKEGIKVYDISSNEQVGQIYNKPNNFHDAVEQDDRILGVWYDKTVAKFETISKVEGQVVIGEDEDADVEMGDDAEEGSVPKRHKLVVNNISADELYAKLSALLETPDRDQIVEICSQNDNENNIKQVLRLFSTDLENSQSIKTFFTIISAEVSQHPTRTKTLSIWLKWSLLIHGGYIANQADQKDNLKNLHKGLTKGMKLMPKLLSLQGRLNLLKSQMQLRHKVGTEQDTDDFVDDDVDASEAGNTINDTTINGTEDTVLFANGETDDFVLNEEYDDEVLDEETEETEAANGGEEDDDDEDEEKDED